ncbi:MAG: hypothetical protein ACREA0_18430, partial [bacterium]
DQDRLLVSTSAMCLIRFMGGHRRDRQFKPFLSNPSPGVGDRLLSNARGACRRVFPSRFAAPAPSLYYETWHTTDTRVTKLRPFETVRRDGSRQGGSLDPNTYLSVERIPEVAARAIQRTISDIEDRFPDHAHVVLTGGKDSQLVHLARKRRPQRWYAFSAEPNYPVVRQWLEDNRIEVADCIRHDNVTDESSAELARKILCGDLYAGPFHLRWIVALDRIARRLGGNVIFWSGTAADAVISWHHDFKGRGRAHFLRQHLTRVATFQGTYHQTVKNYTGCPILSPYHSETFWRDVVLALDDTVLNDRTDFRYAIGELLSGRSVRWPSSNPGPSPYAYGKRVDVIGTYRRMIEASREDFSRTFGCNPALARELP